MLTNEWLKLSKKRSFFIPYAALAALVLFVTYLFKTMDANGEISSGYAFTAWLFNKNGVGQLVTYMAIIGAAGVVAKEHSLGTIKLLLIRAQSRSKILASKYITVLLYTLSLSLVTMLVSVLVGGVAFGFQDTQAGPGAVLLAAAIHYAYTVIYVTITFLIDVLTRSAGATVGIGMTIVLMERIAVQLLSRYDFTKYLVFTHADLSVYLNGATPPFPGMTLTFSLAVIFVYLALFLGVSFVTFKKRDVA
ncbi:ABC transporter permease [Paenibacillus sp. A14]|uniref:ABC transporter permease n=1 Tax=Paenibacillus sp. A14 TaxID=3119820 RepID=UPI002FE19094